MTPIYNQYLRPIRNQRYVSEIAFINTNNSILSHDLYYVEFDYSINKNTGFFLDNNNFLRNLYFETTKDTIESSESICLRNSNNIIRKVQPSKKNYSYIKIINDTINPQLNGEVMIFSYGMKILNFLIDYLIEEKSFNNVFKIILEETHRFPNYDKSHFNDKRITLTDLDLGLNLDINSEIFFKQINVKKIEREEKLKKLTSDIELRNERYQEYLKLKEEFENNED